MSRKKSRREPPTCPYCMKASQKVGGDRIYPHRPDLYAKTFYACFPCGAWVGCHGASDAPLGRLANGNLRRAKNLAHAAFDPLWRHGKADRSQMYAWLAAQLGIPTSECHIGMMDEEMCARVVAVCRAEVDARAAA